MNNIYHAWVNFVDNCVLKEATIEITTITIFNSRK
jgi:hypothetical protein